MAKTAEVAFDNKYRSVNVALFSMLAKRPRGRLLLAFNKKAALNLFRVFVGSMSKNVMK